jgi:hypothetical protein
MADEPIDIGSKIITIAIMLNGNIIETNLAPTKQKIFDNTRLFRLANIVSEPGAVFNDIKMSRIHVLNIVFQHDLLLSTYDAVSRFPVVLSGYKSLFLPEKHRYIPFNITFDKEIGTATLPADANMVVGVYVVSVLEKTGEDNFKLIYPSIEGDKMTNLNLLKKADFIEFENIFRKTGASILNKMFEKSSKWPDYDNSTADDATYKEELDKWNITFSPGGRLNSYGDISYIRLSYLVDIIKEIVGRDKCKINIFDYSPNALSPILSEGSTGTLYPYDIETGSDTTWGGKSIKRRIKKHRKRQITRRNKRRKRAKK